MSIQIDGGTFTYQPNQNFFGTDSFEFRARDDSGLYSGDATITVTVAPVNDVPVVQNEVITSDSAPGLVATKYEGYFNDNFNFWY